MISYLSQARLSSVNVQPNLNLGHAQLSSAHLHPCFLALDLPHIFKTNWSISSSHFIFVQNCSDLMVSYNLVFFNYLSSKIYMFLFHASIFKEDVALLSFVLVKALHSPVFVYSLSQIQFYRSSVFWMKAWMSMCLRGALNRKGWPLSILLLREATSE